jgi:hypothetical protein
MEVGVKIQLNDSQWNRLQTLAREGSQKCPDESLGMSHRLRSNGLIALDRNGYEYLTEHGVRRLSQGR